MPSDRGKALQPTEPELLNEFSKPSVPHQGRGGFDLSSNPFLKQRLCPALGTRAPDTLSAPCTVSASVVSHRDPCPGSVAVLAAGSLCCQTRFDTPSWHVLNQTRLSDSPQAARRGLATVQGRVCHFPRKMDCKVGLCL